MQSWGGWGGSLTFCCPSLQHLWSRCGSVCVCCNSRWKLRGLALAEWNTSVLFPLAALSCCLWLCVFPLPLSSLCPFLEASLWLLSTADSRALKRLRACVCKGSDLKINKLYWIIVCFSAAVGVFDNCSHSRSEKGWSVGIRTVEPAATKDARFYFTLRTDRAVKSTTVYSHQRYQPSVWTHLVATYDGHRMTLYVDGAKVCGVWSVVELTVGLCLTGFVSYFSFSRFLKILKA